MITLIYLPEAEFAVLAASLVGVRISKLRHRLGPLTGFPMIVDEFQGELAGLILAEVEFKTAEDLRDYPALDFAALKVTDDLRYAGAHLARHGRPDVQA